MEPDATKHADAAETAAATEYAAAAETADATEYADAAETADAAEYAATTGKNATAGAFSGR